MPITRLNALAVSLLLLTACSDSNDSYSPAPVLPDFAAADAWMANFVETEESFPGGSYIIVDRELGVIHKAAFGNQTEDSLVLLASTSKVPTVMLLMALHDDDDNLNFDIQVPIADYLPWVGVWDPAITTEHLVSNRSGMPGLAYVFSDPVAYTPHICQFLPSGTLQDCGETIYTTLLPPLESTPANTAFDYGGSQWQLSGVVAEIVGGAGWNQLWDQYIAGPCDLEIATFGNNLSNPTEWDGSPESLNGLDNPNMEGGMMSNLDDYAKLLSMHLHDGLCGDNRVMSADSVASMRELRTLFDDGGGYGMGWWLEPAAEGSDTFTLFTDAGLYGSISWIDTERRYAGVAFFEDYTGAQGGTASGGVRDQMIPIIEAAIDAVE